MPFPSVTPLNSHHRIGTFTDVFARPSTELYQTLGGITNATYSIKLDTSNDSSGRNKTNNTYLFEASCDMMQGSLVEMELLDTLIAGTSAFLFKLPDAGAIPAAAAVTEGWVLLSSSQVGCNVAPNLSGTPADKRLTKVSWRGSILASALDAAVKASIDDGDFEATGGTGTIKAIGTYSAALDGGRATPANNKTGGVSTLTACWTGGSPVTLGPVYNVNFTFSPINDEGDSLRIFRQVGFNINLEYDLPETDAATLLGMNDMAADEMDLAVTFLSGLIVALSNKVGAGTDFRSAASPSDKRFIHFVHTGTILTSAFDGIVSGA